jgi:hypothetical protein
MVCNGWSITGERSCESQQRPGWICLPRSQPISQLLHRLRPKNRFVSML